MEKEKLKTLKEIEQWSNGFEPTKFVYISDLRAEAVKDLNINGLTNVLGNLTDLEVIAIRKYIVWKNNLTEEDLK